jgi:hypothetical protein
MKNSITTLTLSIVLALGIACFQSCKKSEDLIAPSGIESNSKKNNLALDAGSIYVSTVCKLPQVGNINRIGIASSGTIYVTDYPSDKVYKIRNDSVVTVLAENVNSPNGVKVGKDGNVYVALYFDNKIIKITPSGVISDVPVSLSMNRPTDVAIADDSTLYIADAWHQRILKVTPSGQASVLAGSSGKMGIVDGSGSSARFNYPTSLKLGSDGNLWVVDGTETGGSGLCLRKVTITGTVTTPLLLPAKGKKIFEIAPAKADAKFNPTATGNVFVLYNDNTITHFNPTTRVETPVSINKAFGYKDGPINTALFDSPVALSFHNNSLYFADGASHTIRKIYKK